MIKKRFLTIVTALLLATITLCMVACNPVTNTNNETKQASLIPVEDTLANGSMEIVQFASAENLSIKASPTVVKTMSLMNAPLLGATQTYLEKTLTATVLPEGLEDEKKKVDWAVEWLDQNGFTGDVTNYVDVIPSSDGSTTASMRAYQPFEGAKIKVTVTTRYGGYSADCIVGYDGKPTSLHFVYNNTEYSSTQTANLEVSKTYYVDLKLINTLGVGSKYGTYEIEAMGGTGAFMAYKKEILNAAVTSTEEVKLQMSDIYNQFFTASIENGKLKLTITKSILAYVSGYPRTGTRYEYKCPFVDPRSGGVADVPIVYVVVKDTVSNVSAMLKINIESAVTGVNVSNVSYDF